MKGYTANIEKLAIENGNFRKVLYTCTNCQLVLMSLLPQQEIGEEVHDVDQFFRIEKGQGAAIINGESHEISDGSAVVIPAGAKHNIINRGNEPLKLYSLYMPPHHKDGVVHTTKEIGEADTTDLFDGTTTELLK